MVDIVTGAVVGLIATIMMGTGDDSLFRPLYRGRITS